MDEQASNKYPSRFKAGAPSANKKGRPPAAREAARLAILAEVANADKWKEICEAAVDDAIRGYDGPTRDRGRRFVAEYLIGKPNQTVNVNLTRDDLPNEWAELSDEELEALAESSAGGVTGEADGAGGVGPEGAGTPEAD